MNFTAVLHENIKRKILLKLCIVAYNGLLYNDQKEYNLI